MFTNNSDDKSHFLIDFHTHSHYSFDGFSTEEEIIRVCLTRKINAIAITEHDLVCKLDSKKFELANITLIKGCEFTCEYGAHIIGLFIDRPLPKGSSRIQIIQHIKDQDGLVMLPHPWKKESGYFSCYHEDDVLMDVDLIELYNGGWNSKDYHESIRMIAKKYDMRLVGSSDSHKAWQIGYYVSGYELLSGNQELKNMIATEQPVIYCNEKEISPPRKISVVQSKLVYQRSIIFLPYVVKRFLKRAIYSVRSRHFVPTEANYEQLY